MPILTWPARANVVQAKLLFAQLRDAGTSDFVIDGYPEYGTDPSALEPAQRETLRRAAQQIVRSQATMQPIRAFLVVGHADKALRKAVSERAAFELAVSERRARSASEALFTLVNTLASKAHYAKTLQHAAFGVGNKKPRVPNAVTEADMRKNRRVEIVLAPTRLPPPRCGTR